MNRKILVISILAVFMLIAISFATVVSSNTTISVKKKESPLFGIRTRLAIGERLQDLKETIKARFVGDRLFFLPFKWLNNRNDLSVRQLLQEKDTNMDETCHQHTLICTCTEECEYTDWWETCDCRLLHD